MEQLSCSKNFEFQYKKLRKPNFCISAPRFYPILAVGPSLPFSLYFSPRARTRPARLIGATWRAMPEDRKAPRPAPDSTATLPRPKIAESPPYPLPRARSRHAAEHPGVPLPAKPLAALAARPSHHAEKAVRKQRRTAESRWHSEAQAAQRGTVRLSGAQAAQSCTTRHCTTSLSPASCGRSA